MALHASGKTLAFRHRLGINDLAHMKNFNTHQPGILLRLHGLARILVAWFLGFFGGLTWLRSHRFLSSGFRDFRLEKGKIRFLFNRDFPDKPVRPLFYFIKIAFERLFYFSGLLLRDRETADTHLYRVRIFKLL